jgi:hypothetical protein
MRFMYAYAIGWGWGRTMEKVWPRMPWDSLNEISHNDIHDVMQMLGDGGSICKCCRDILTSHNICFHHPQASASRTYSWAAT